MPGIDWTYEKAPAGAPAEGLEGFAVRHPDGELLGRVVTVLDRDSDLYLAVSKGTPPVSGPVVAVAWTEVREVDHDLLEIELAELRGDYPELPRSKAVEQGTGDAEAVRVTQVPEGAPPHSLPEATPIRDRGRVIMLGIASVVSLFAAFVVLMLTDRAESPWPLALLVIPLFGLAIVGLLFRRTLRAPYSHPRSGD